MRTGVLLALAVVMALATAAVGWWAVPLAAALIAAVAHGTAAGILRRPGGSCAAGAALAGALAWGALLLVDALGERFGAVARLVGGVAGVPPAVVVALTLLLPALLAWSAAAVVEGVLAAARPAPGRRPRSDDGDDGRRRRAPAPPPAVTPTRPLPSLPDLDGPLEPEGELVGSGAR